MFVLPILAYLMNADRLFSSPSHLGRTSRTWRERDRRGHESCTASQAILAISAKVLERLLPAVACLLPVYEPILVALMLGCVTLAARFRQGIEQ